MDKIKMDELLSSAILREIEAREFYMKVSEQVEDANVKQVFLDLAKEERGHMEILEKFENDPTFVMKFDSTLLVDFKVAESSDTPKLSINMKPADAIALAIKKEQMSMEFYLGLSQRADDPEVKRIFDILSKMELSHKVKLENVFVEIGYPEVF